MRVLSVLLVARTRDSDPTGEVIPLVVVAAVKAS
jgi:hypothetical protein